MNSARDTRDNPATTGALSGLDLSLAGGFHARPGNLTGSRLDLFGPSGSRGLPPSVVVAELHFDGSRRATLEFDGATAVMENGGPDSVMSLGGTRLLDAVKSGGSRFDVVYLATTYEARLSPLRNSARVFRNGEEVCRIGGSLFGRDYRVTFRDGLLPVAVFVLWKTALLRRRAFVVGGVRGQP